MGVCGLLLLLDFAVRHHLNGLAAIRETTGLTGDNTSLAGLGAMLAGSIALNLAFAFMRRYFGIDSWTKNNFPSGEV